MTRWITFFILAGTMLPPLAASPAWIPQEEPISLPAPAGAFISSLAQTDLLGTFIIIVVAMCLFFFWIKQLADLMRLPDDCFPGRYDKVLWFFLIFFASVLGAFLFWLWKVPRLVERKAPAPERGVGPTTTESADAEQAAE